MGQALAGLVAGGAYALIAVCLVLMYQMLGVLNFAQSALGALAACVSLLALTKWHWGPWPATVLAVACGALLSGVVGLVMARYFLETSVVTRSTVTIASEVASESSSACHSGSGKITGNRPFCNELL